MKASIQIAAFHRFLTMLNAVTNRHLPRKNKAVWQVSVVMIYKATHVVKVRRNAIANRFYTQMVVADGDLNH